MLKKALLGFLLSHCLIGSAADVRDGPLRTLNGSFPFTPVENPAEWAARSEALRIRTRMAVGLWPEPEKTALNAVIHGRVDRPTYTIEKVYFESLPGHFVTGNLYRPKTGGKKKMPGILSPHGHWSGGRFHAHNDDTLEKELASGGERFARGGRYPLQSRCVQLARMGCTVFHYDMIGYADSQQFSAHRPGVRSAMNTRENWGLFSPQAELRLQSLMQLQTWNSVRALDFLESLPEVDGTRLGVTGASGGATQTMMLMAVDGRPSVAFPAVMVSTGMQGGCPCENASYLRINSGNIDIAALAAPRRLGLTGANDWTVEIMTKGWPDLKKLYQLIGYGDHVHAEAFTQFGHNFNAVSRGVMYAWFNQAWQLVETPPVESDYEPLTRVEMSVWNEEHPAPTGGDAHERAVMRWFADQKIDSYPREKFEDVYRPAWTTMVGRDLAGVGAVRRENEVLHNAQGEEVAIAEVRPDHYKGDVIIALGDVEVGHDTDEFCILRSALYRPGEKNRLGKYGNGSAPWQKFAGYTYGYNHALFVQRVHDVLTMIRYAQAQKPQRIHLVADEEYSAIAAAARVVAAAAIHTLVLAPGDFSFARINTFDDPHFVPGAVKYGGMDALISLNAALPTVIVGGTYVSRFPPPAQLLLSNMPDTDDLFAPIQAQ